MERRRDQEKRAERGEDAGGDRPEHPADAMDGEHVEGRARQVAVVKRLGEYRKTHEPGLVIIGPFIDSLQRVDMREIPRPGDYVTRTVGTEPVIMVRAGDGEIKTACQQVCPADRQPD